MWKIHASCSVGWLLVKQLVSNNFLLYLLCAILKAKLCNPLDCWKARLHGRKKWRADCMCYKRYSVIHCRYIILWLIAIELEAIHILIFDIGCIVTQRNYPSQKHIHWELIVSQFNCAESYHRKYYSSISLDSLQGVYQEGQMHQIWWLLGKQGIVFHKIF